MGKIQANRAILIVLDSLGVGAAHDASRFGDEDANTLLHIAEWAEKSKYSFQVPRLASWGLGDLCPHNSLKFNGNAKASRAKLVELSPGKDTTTGHWEMAGHVLTKEFPVFENGFDKKLLDRWCEENKLSGYLGNYAASGTTILDDLGEEHIKTSKPIVYTSGDSVFQVACSEETFGLQRLYDICLSARKLLDPLGVGRVIARPFVGHKKGSFKRTENRRDYSVPPPAPHLLDLLRKNNCFVAGVGKIEDIFAHRSVNLVNHTGRNETSIEATLDYMNKTRGERGLIFTNLIDFDMLHGHRRNPQSYAEALMYFDSKLAEIEAACSEDDLVILTADHGNDPTHRGSDHTREMVPLLFWSPQSNFSPRNYGVLQGFTHVSRLILDSLSLSESVKEMPDTLKAQSFV